MGGVTLSPRRGILMKIFCQNRRSMCLSIAWHTHRMYFAACTWNIWLLCPLSFYFFQNASELKQSTPVVSKITWVSGGWAHHRKLDHAAHTTDRHVSEEGTEGGGEIIALVAHYAHYWVIGLISPMLYVGHEWTFFHRYIHNIFPLIQNEFPL